jgi:hypothetical protein
MSHSFAWLMVAKDAWSVIWHLLPLVFFIGGDYLIHRGGSRLAQEFGSWLYVTGAIWMFIITGFWAGWWS